MERAVLVGVAWADLVVCRALWGMVAAGAVAVVVWVVRNW